MKNTLVDALMSVGRTYVAAGDDQKALERFERALTLADALGNPRFQSFALRSIGGIYVRRRQPGPAGSYLERSLLAQIGLGDRRIEARIRIDIGESSGTPRRASSCRRVVRRCPQAQPRGDRPRRSSKGAVRPRPGLNRAWRSDRARRYSSESLAVIESLRTATDRSDLRTSYLASVHRHYEQQVEILMRLHEAKPLAGFAADAFEAAERARARSLLDNLTQARIELRADVDPDLLKREEAVNKAFDTWAEAQRRNAGADQEADAAAYRDLEDRYQQVQAEIRGRSPRYAALTQPRPLTLAAVQKQLLAGDTVLLEYALGERRSFLWAVSSSSYATYLLPPQAEIEALSQRVYERLTARLQATGNARDRRRQIEQADEAYWQEAAAPQRGPARPGRQHHQGQENPHRRRRRAPASAVRRAARARGQRRPHSDADGTRNRRVALGLRARGAARRDQASRAGGGRGRGDRRSRLRSGRPAPAWRGRAPGRAAGRPSVAGMAARRAFHGWPRRDRKPTPSSRRLRRER